MLKSAQSIVIMRSIATAQSCHATQPAADVAAAVVVSQASCTSGSLHVLIVSAGNHSGPSFQAMTAAYATQGSWRSMTVPSTLRTTS